MLKKKDSIVSVKILTYNSSLCDKTLQRRVQNRYVVLLLLAVLFYRPVYGRTEKEREKDTAEVTNARVLLM
jgi:hypothetical protein